MIDHTHDAKALTWVPGAMEHPEFPVQNLPFGLFDAGTGPTIGMAIGDQVLDLSRATDRLGLNSAIAAALRAPRLNPLMALGASARQAVRHAVFDLLTDTTYADMTLLHAQDAVTLLLPAEIGDFTDFYAGIHHATNAARRRFPDRADPLAENYKYVPVGYHSRTSSVRVSGAAFRRPSGQCKPAEGAPVYRPSALLDFELELAVHIGPGNELGTPIPITDAAAHIWGYGLMNDLSARDIQRWESWPLGPFLGKSFGTVISPWIVTPEALAPFRVRQAPRPDGDPAPLPHLWCDTDQAQGAIRAEVSVHLASRRMREDGREPDRLATANVTDLYWTPAQFVAHHTSNGCNLCPGDLFGSGTISGPAQGSYGSLNELTETGTRRLPLSSGETRLFLEDGDQVILRGRCSRDGFATIGFGDCACIILP